MTTRKSPQFKRPVTFCGATMQSADGNAVCHRLPAHHGEHSAFVRGNGVTPPKAAKQSTAKADKVVTRGGVKYAEKRRTNGSIVLTPVAASVTEEPVPQPKAPASKRSAANARKAPAKPAEARS
jgi:hypothetical protein